MAMLPIVPTINTYTLPPPIVNTAIPGTAITHVPYDNVAPSVSNAQVDNNARGNSTPPPSPADQPASTPQDTVDTATFSNAPNSTSNSLNIGAQASFIAQLAGQDVSPETQGVLLQYEKLVTISNVKYKPSNALKPISEPANQFGRIIQSERSVPKIVQAVPSEPLPATSVASESASAASAISLAEPRPIQRSTKIQASSTDTVTSTDITTGGEPNIPTPIISTIGSAISPEAISAYTATASRVTSQSLVQSQELA